MKYNFSGLACQAGIDKLRLMERKKKTTQECPVNTFFLSCEHSFFYLLQLDFLLRSHIIL